MTSTVINFPSRDEREWRQTIEELRAQGLPEHAAEWVINDFRPRIERISKCSYQFSCKPGMTQEEIAAAIKNLVEEAQKTVLKELITMEAELYGALHS